MSINTEHKSAESKSFDQLNPLHPSPLKNHVIPFAQLKISDFVPELKKAIELAKSRLAAIENDPSEPTFLNTLQALETCSEEVDLITSVFYNLLSAHTSPELQMLALEIGPIASNFSSDILLSEKIFERIQHVYKTQMSQLSIEERALTEKMYSNFTRNGALLSPEDKEILRELDSEMSKLGPKFNENVLAATNEFKLVLKQKDEVAGLPASILEAAKQLATEMKIEDAWVFTLNAPSYVPFMQYANHRPSREKMYRAFANRCIGGKFDNSENVLKILQSREKRAKLLGFKNHADFVLQKRMAGSPEKVFSFLQRLKAASLSSAQKDVQDVTAFAKKRLAELNVSNYELMPWDFSYWSEKLKEERFQFKEEDLRPYFQLENVISGVFKHAEKLFNIEFKEAKEIPVYHPDVKAFEVFEKDSGDFVGVFYCDFFPRESKNGGAWMTNYHEQGLYRQKVQRPHVAIVCNFTKPTSTNPSLLTFIEVRTLFHEFGHALHSLLSKCKFRSLSGTNVYWDFVELPSQIMENWAYEKECLDLFALHYKTGEKLPESLAKKLEESSHFMAGYMSLRQVTFALLDMAYHSTPTSEIRDPAAFEEKIVSDLRVLPKVDGAHFSHAFSHIFGGGYSAGYYSYKWAEVLDADAFELFKEKGIYNTDVATKFRDHILSRGGTDHPMELYKNFRGREPDPDALLRRDGLLN